VLDRLGFSLLSVVELRLARAREQLAEQRKLWARLETIATRRCASDACVGGGVLRRLSAA